MIHVDWRQPVPDELACGMFVDTSYPANGDDETLSKALKAAIERETGEQVQDVDIGAGASWPAFLLAIDPTSAALGAAAIALFFKGKAIEENLDSWISLASRLKKLLHRVAVLNRSAAAALALDELLQLRPLRVGEAIVLLEYLTYDNRFEDLDNASTTVEPTTLEYHGHLGHVFRFAVGAEVFIVVVDGRDVMVVKQEAS